MSPISDESIVGFKQTSLSTYQDVQHRCISITPDECKNSCTQGILECFLKAYLLQCTSPKITDSDCPLHGTHEAQQNLKENTSRSLPAPILNKPTPTIKNTRKASEKQITKIKADPPRNASKVERTLSPTKTSIPPTPVAERGKAAITSPRTISALNGTIEEVTERKVSISSVSSLSNKPAHYAIASASSTPMTFPTTAIQLPSKDVPSLSCSTKSTTFERAVKPAEVEEKGSPNSIERFRLDSDDPLHMYYSDYSARNNRYVLRNTPDSGEKKRTLRSLINPSPPSGDSGGTMRTQSPHPQLNTRLTPLKTDIAREDAFKHVIGTPQTKQVRLVADGGDASITSSCKSMNHNNIPRTRAHPAQPSFAQGWPYRDREVTYRAPPPPPPPSAASYYPYKLDRQERGDSSFRGCPQHWGGSSSMHPTIPQYVGRPRLFSPLYYENLTCRTPVRQSLEVAEARDFDFQRYIRPRASQYMQVGRLSQPWRLKEPILRRDEVAVRMDPRIVGKLESRLRSANVDRKAPLQKKVVAEENRPRVKMSATSLYKSKVRPSGNSHLIESVVIDIYQ